MIRVAMVASSGGIDYVAYPQTEDCYVYGDTYGDHVALRLPDDAPDDDTVLGLWWLDFSDKTFKQRPPKPSGFYVWVGGNWEFDGPAKSDWLSQTINPIRDELEASRVTVDGHLIDIDERAEKRMSDALTLWDDMGVTTLEWTLGDNTQLTVDKAQLQRFYDEGRRLRALRALQLHSESRALKDNLDTTQDDIDAWAASYA